MGDVGDEFFLIFISVSHTYRHIIQGSCQSSDLIVAFNRDPVAEITGGIFLHCQVDFLERQVYKAVEKQKEHQGKDVYHEETYLGDIQDPIPFPDKV